MPWTPAQHRLFEAAAHDPAIAKARGIAQPKAAAMASEGIKTVAAPKIKKAPAVAAPTGPRGPNRMRATPQALAKALTSDQ